MNGTTRQVGEQMLEAVVAYVGRAVTPLLRRIEALEGALAAKDAALNDHGKALTEAIKRLDAKVENIPAGPAGRDGLDGMSVYEVAVANGFEGDAVAWLESLKGDQGEAARVDEKQLQDLIDVAVMDAVNALPPPKDGEKGEPGELGKVDYDEVADLVGAAVKIAMERIPAPKDGADGKSVTLADVEPIIEAEIEKRLLKWPRPKDGVDGVDGKDGAPGKDGQSVDLEDVIPIIQSAVDQRVAEIPPPERGEKGERGERGNDGRDGKDGRDGLDGENGINGKDAADLEPLPMIDPDRRYPRGTWALTAGGMVRAARNTDPANGKKLTDCGWEVVLNGVESETEESLKRGRILKRVTTYTDGTTFEREFVTENQIWQGVWKDGQEYMTGDTATWGGSTWHCNEPTKDRPGTSKAWTLMAKQGDKGKPAPPPEEPQPPKPVKIR